MNKNLSISALLVIILTGSVFTAAKTAFAATESTGSANTVQIEELKARLATKVAELRTVVKKAVSGTVKSVSVSSATIETKTKDVKIELTDDVTVSQIISGKRTPLTSDDIETGDSLTVFGSYDETLDLLKASHIFIESSTPVRRVAGAISDIDEKTYALTIRTLEGRDVTVDIEKSTKTTIWTKTDGLSKGGFSKLNVGDTVHIVGRPNAKSENRISAVRILDLGNITGASDTPAPTVSPAEESTGSGKQTP